MDYLDKDTGVPGGVPGEGDHAEIASFLLYIRNAIAEHKKLLLVPR